MEVRTIRQKVRGCGKRKKGGCYLVSEPSENGFLPLWTKIDPPIPYNQPHFRGYITIDLERVLGGEKYEDYIVAATRDRVARYRAKEHEIDTFGMPLARRERIGVCRLNGLGALTAHVQTDWHSLGRDLRRLSKASLGKGTAELAIAFRKAQKMEKLAVLASLWRLWRKVPKGQRVKILPIVAAAMTHLGYEKDALDIQL